MLIEIGLLILGLILLLKGADWLVDGASTLAKRYKVSDLAIGLTIVAFGTSAPELVVNGFASAQNHHDIVFGNVIGSNNFNLFVILGIVGLIMPLRVQSSTIWKEIPLSFVALLFLFVLVNDFLTGGVFTLSRVEGGFLLLLFVGFIFYIYTQLKSDPEAIEVEEKSLSKQKQWAFIVFGLASLVIGGKLVVDNAIDLASDLGVSEKIIGLTIVAAGTSLPELATSLVAALKGKNDIAVGNIVGSNIFNILLILGVSSLINPIQYEPRFNSDLYFLAGGTLFLFIAMFIGKKRVLERWQAAVLILAFISYSFYLIAGEG